MWVLDYILRLDQARITLTVSWYTPHLSRMTQLTVSSILHMGARLERLAVPPGTTQVHLALYAQGRLIAELMTTPDRLADAWLDLICEPVTEPLEADT